jgi:CBS-domain-containing membrane protein
VIEAPFAQPRAIFFGHTISALIGVSITKLFLHLPPDSFQENLWLAGALSCAAASTLMAITKTIHPPSGGTALIAATQADVRALGWYYIPVVMLSSVLMIAVGLITNNIQRQYPIYWWTSAPLKPASQKEKHEKEGNTSMELRENSTTKVNDLEKGLETVIIAAQKVTVPEFIRLSYDQKAVLNDIQTKIKEYYNITEES